MTVNKIGFIGLGSMGRPMAVNLIKAGTSVMVHNRSQQVVRELSDTGADPATGVAHIASQCNRVFLCLPNEETCEAILMGDDGVFKNVQPGTIVVDHSTVSVGLSKQAAVQAEQVGAKFLDAPISGGPTGAIDGTLSIMVGGDESAYKEVLPEFEKMGTNVVRFGDSGAGTAMKLINQLLTCVHTVAAAEAFNLANNAGVDILKATDLLQKSFGGSTMVGRSGPITAAREFENSGAPMRNLIKDIGIIMEMAKEMKLSMPTGAAAAEILYEGRNSGLSDLDTAATIVPIESQSNL